MNIHFDPSGFWQGNSGSVHFGATNALAQVMSAGFGLRYLNQVHEDGLVRDEDYIHCFQTGDGLISRQSNLALTIRTADCIPLHLWDKNRIGMIHAGWRSTKQDIVTKAIQDFKTAELSAIIGPSICQENYEVDADLYEPWLKNWPHLATFLSLAKPGTTKRLFDLRALVEWQLLNAGIPAERIHKIPTCTFSSPLPSYRREGKHAGRIVNYIYRHP